MRTKRIRMVIAIAILIAGAARADETKPRDREEKTYESPIVSLLFLPVTLLIRIATAIAPQPAGSGAASETATTPDE